MYFGANLVLRDSLLYVGGAGVGGQQDRIVGYRVHQDEWYAREEVLLEGRKDMTAVMLKNGKVTCMPN